ncbi:MAG TPA: isoprenylcysteine carboxylmethyltransferase family protein [Vicinamibacterales bacterium]|nr:isoprenylcysteine carboxylmethyltransferase family protein [Vicinamibacterales bacterium]
MDDVRYGIAVTLLLGMPLAIALWITIHPFARAWRRIGVKATYAVLLVPGFALDWALWVNRTTLIGADWGTQPALLVLAAVTASIGVWIARARRLHLTPQILVGVPELSSSDKGRLLTEGIYSRVRNPRYLEVLFGMVTYACVANYSGTWALALLSAPGLHLVVLLEESELRDRFGADYDDYCRRVPRWIPRRQQAGT